MTIRLALAWFFVAVSLGCGDLFQDYETGVRLFCESPLRCEDLWNGHARAVFDKTATFEPARRGPVLRSVASKAGVRPCPMADWMEAAAAL